MGWKEEHDKLYGNLSDRPVHKALAPGPKRFPVVKVSERSQDLVQDLEQAYQRMLAAESKEEIEAAYSALCQRRKEIYEALECLDELTGMLRQVTKRFD